MNERDKALQEAASAHKQTSDSITRSRTLLISDEGYKDVTEDVVSVLDCLVHSLDWGSQFLSDEDVAAAERLMDALGFDHLTKSVNDRYTIERWVRPGGKGVER